jgi:predicted Zn-dependent protease
VWKSGYNPDGFIEFFDIMASKEGYVEKTSFFRTHPAFYDRIVESYREISFLPKQESSIETTKDFETIQAKLKKMSEDLDKEEKDRPSLYKREEGCSTEPVEPQKPKPSMTETPSSRP